MVAITTSKIDPTEALAHAFPKPQPNKPNIPRYYTLYSPNDVVVSKEDIKFTNLLDERRKEVHDNHLTKHQIGAWWCMRKFLNVERSHMEQYRKMWSLLEFMMRCISKNMQKRIWKKKWEKLALCSGIDIWLNNELECCIMNPPHQPHQKSLSIEKLCILCKPMGFQEQLDLERKDRYHPTYCFEGKIQGLRIMGNFEAPMFKKNPCNSSIQLRQERSVEHCYKICQKTSLLKIQLHLSIPKPQQSLCQKTNHNQHQKRVVRKK